MARPVVLSNGELFVGLDGYGLVHDFYYPYVGLDNLTTARSSQHKVGVWVDGNFSWTNEPGWDISINFEDDALISTITMRSSNLGVNLEFQDFVDVKYNAFIRCVKVTNEADAKRDVRLFMHQAFQISRGGRADTAMYVPDDHYLMDYKGRCCLLIAGKINEKEGFDQFAVGSYGIEGKAGTFQDAEDGELSGNAVEHGGVDSVLRFRQELEPGASYEVDYWIVAADSQTDAQVVHTHLKYYPIKDRRELAREHWQEWLNIGRDKLDKIAEQHKAITQKSQLIIRAHCDERGSILASGDSSIFNYGRDYYCYCWPRDAAYAVWPLIRLGHFEEARKFFDFSRDTMHRDGYLMHKFQPDRAIGSTWHPLLHGRHKELAIQEDETAIVVYMMSEFFEASGDGHAMQSYYDTFIRPCAAFMANYIDHSTGLPHASYDLWEQKFLTSTYTVYAVVAALERAAKLSEKLERPADGVRWREAAEGIRENLHTLYHPDGYWRKGFLLQPSGELGYDDTLDISSFYGAFMFGGSPLDDPRLLGTLKHVEDRLFNTSPIGGVIRFEHDGYFLSKTQYKGNPWVVCTLWLAQYYMAAGREDEARKLVDWSCDRATTSGAISEQFDPETGYAKGVTPLVWSHAELVNTVLDIAKIK